MRKPLCFVLFVFFFLSLQAPSHGLAPKKSRTPDEQFLIETIDILLADPNKTLDETRKKNIDFWTALKVLPITSTPPWLSGFLAIALEDQANPSEENSAKIIELHVTSMNSIERGRQSLIRRLLHKPDLIDKCVLQALIFLNDYMLKDQTFENLGRTIKCSVLRHSAQNHYLTSVLYPQMAHTELESAAKHLGTFYDHAKEIEDGQSKTFQMNAAYPLALNVHLKRWALPNPSGNETRESALANLKALLEHHEQNFEHHYREECQALSFILPVNASDEKFIRAKRDQLLNALQFSGEDPARKPAILSLLWLIAQQNPKLWLPKNQTQFIETFKSLNEPESEQAIQRILQQTDHSQYNDRLLTLLQSLVTATPHKRTQIIIQMHIFRMKQADPKEHDQVHKQYMAWSQQNDFPFKTYLHVNQGLLAKDQGKLEEALKHFKKASQSPENVLVQEAHSEWLFLLRDLQLKGSELLFSAEAILAFTQSWKRFLEIQEKRPFRHQSTPELNSIRLFWQIFLLLSNNINIPQEFLNELKRITENGAGPEIQFLNAYLAPNPQEAMQSFYENPDNQTWLWDFATTPPAMRSWSLYRFDHKYRNQLITMFFDKIDLNQFGDDIVEIALLKRALETDTQAPWKMPKAQKLKAIWESLQGSDQQHIIFPEDALIELMRWYMHNDPFIAALCKNLSMDQFRTFWKHPHMQDAPLHSSSDSRKPKEAMLLGFFKHHQATKLSAEECSELGIILLSLQGTENPIHHRLLKDKALRPSRPYVQELYEQEQWDAFIALWPRASKGKPQLMDLEGAIRTGQKARATSILEKLSLSPEDQSHYTERINALPEDTVATDKPGKQKKGTKKNNNSAAKALESGPKATDIKRPFTQKKFESIQTNYQLKNLYDTHPKDVQKFCLQLAAYVWHNSEAEALESLFKSIARPEDSAPVLDLFLWTNHHNGDFFELCHKHSSTIQTLLNKSLNPETTKDPLKQALALSHKTMLLRLGKAIQEEQSIGDSQNALWAEMFAREALKENSDQDARKELWSIAQKFQSKLQERDLLSPQWHIAIAYSNLAEGWQSRWLDWTNKFKKHTEHADFWETMTIEAIDHFIQEEDLKALELLQEVKTGQSTQAKGQRGKKKKGQAAQSSVVQQKRQGLAGIIENIQNKRFKEELDQALSDPKALSSFLEKHHSSLQPEILEQLQQKYPEDLRIQLLQNIHNNSTHVFYIQHQQDLITALKSQTSSLNSTLLNKIEEAIKDTPATLQKHKAYLRAFEIDQTLEELELEGASQSISHLKLSLEKITLYSKGNPLFNPYDNPVWLNTIKETFERFESSQTTQDPQMLTLLSELFNWKALSIRGDNKIEESHKTATYQNLLEQSKSLAEQAERLATNA